MGWIIVGGIVAAAGIVGGYWWWHRNDCTTPGTYLCYNGRTGCEVYVCGPNSQWVAAPANNHAGRCNTVGTVANPNQC